MEIVIEFLVDFDKAHITDEKYTSLSKLLQKPVAVTRGQVVALVHTSGGIVPQSVDSVFFDVPEEKPIDKMIMENIAVIEGSPAEVKSAIPGFLCAREGAIVVTSMMEIFGDVGPLTGNISSGCSIRVHGGVSENYKVTSMQNVEVLGLVEVCHIEAKGKVILKGGIVGADKCVITAGGDLYAKYAQQSSLSSKENIILDGPAINCELKAGKKITFRGRNSSMVGGCARAREEISAPVVGSKGAIPTKIFLGFDPFKDKKRGARKERTEALIKKYKEKEKELIFAKKQMRGDFVFDLKDILSCLFQLSEIQISGATEGFGKEKQIAFHTLAEDLLVAARIKEELMQLENEDEKEEAEPPFANAALKVSQITHPGVTITISEHVFITVIEYEHLKFMVRNDQVEQATL